MPEDQQRHAKDDTGKSLAARDAGLTNSEKRHHAAPDEDPRVVIMQAARGRQESDDVTRERVSHASKSTLCLSKDRVCRVPDRARGSDVRARTRESLGSTLPEEGIRRVIVHRIALSALRGPRKRFWNG